MAVTSIDPVTGRDLTSIGPAKAGDEVTLTISNPITAGQFTTYRLGQVLGVNQWGENLFDLDEAEVLVGGLFVSQEAIREAKAKAGWGPSLELAGMKFRKTAFGHWAYVEG